MLGYLKASAYTVDEVVELLVTEFNKTKETIPTLQFVDMHVTTVIDAPDTILFFGVIVTEHTEPELKKPRFIGMPANADPTNPDWSRTYIGS